MNPEKIQASKTQSTFILDCSVEIVIAASAERVWALLTNAQDFSRWNSTVTKIEGEIAEGQKLKITVPSAPGQTFKPKVSGLEPNRAMTWSDGMAPMFKGVRTFALSDAGGGRTKFAMREVFSGLMLPMIKGSLPDFGPIFETYAQDLKRAAEAST